MDGCVRWAFCSLDANSCYAWFLEVMGEDWGGFGKRRVQSEDIK